MSFDIPNNVGPYNQEPERENPEGDIDCNDCSGEETESPAVWKNNLGGEQAYLELKHEGISIQLSSFCYDSIVLSQRILDMINELRSSKTKEGEKRIPLGV